MPRYPPINPYEEGFLDTGDGNLVHWEVCGNPSGKPALIVHGGPGSGLSTGQRQWLDPARYRIIQFDQRGCGRSTPHASDPTTDMRLNTTNHLVSDMERLRDRLGVDRWLLFGESWGSTLILTYAERYPERVSEIVICSVTMTRRSEIDWLYRGVARFFPEEWAQFRAGIPEREWESNIVGAYAMLMEHPNLDVRTRAAIDWAIWEDTVLSLEPNGKRNPYSDRPLADLLAFVRITTQYFSNGAWLEEGALLSGAMRLAGIPGVLIHGRLDLSCPVTTAWELASAWPDAHLIVVADSGHKGSDSMNSQTYDALERFADR